MSTKFTIGYFYPSHLNLYGDNGNIEVLYQRATLRALNVDVKLINLDTQVNGELMDSLDLIFMGGGPDSGQKEVFDDFLKNKGPFVKTYIEDEKTALFICGSYQLAGNYYKSADGSILEGLGIFNLHTEHFGNTKPRCIGNTVCSVANFSAKDAYGMYLSAVGNHLVGFENHGGRTYLENGVTPLGTVIKGHGNNSEDKTEGAVYKNSFGTYYHGPFLALNPHFADFLIAKSLKIIDLPPLDDTIALNAHKSRL
jgi:CobQ-like glutamine amidotransferase family enzyme